MEISRKYEQTSRNKDMYFDKEYTLLLYFYFKNLRNHLRPLITKRAEARHGGAGPLKLQ